MLISAAGCGRGIVTIKGTVQGGVQPLSGATVTLWRMGSSGYGRGASPLAESVAKADGRFTLTFLCLPGTQVYATAQGSDSASGAGHAIVMMAAIGDCAAVPRHFAFNINELTTVASTWTLAQFMNYTGGASVVSAAGGGLGAQEIGAPPSNATGLANAVALAANLVDVRTGTIATPPNTSLPASELNTLADILAGCVNSAGAGSPQCQALFTCATPGSAFPPEAGAPCMVPADATTAQDTLEAALDIARNPAHNVGALFGLIPPIKPFSPTLAAGPTDWSVAIRYTGGAIDSLGAGLAIDAEGDAWIANSATASITKLSPTGVPLSGKTGFTGGGMLAPVGLAIDNVGNVWITNLSGNSLSKFKPSGALITPPFGILGGGLSGPLGIAIDQSGGAWVANQRGSTLSRFTASGTPLSPQAGFSGGGLTNPFGIALDSKGDAWVANRGDDNVSEFDPAGLALSPQTGFADGGLDAPVGIAIDSGDNVWVSNSGRGEGHSVTELDSSGNAISPDPAGFIGGGLHVPGAVAIDGAGHVWVANSGSITELDSTGAALSPASGFTESGGNLGFAIAIDGAGDVWVLGSSDSASEFVGIAAPVATPLIGPAHMP